MNYERYDIDHLKSMRFGYIHTISNPCNPQIAEYVKRELEKLDKEISKRLQLTLQFPEEDQLNLFRDVTNGGKENESQS